ncbi:uncharacterized protein si:dkey-197j19.6 isoform X1 [Astyanax mexicanus]|uniref:Si:dkey-197j19.6 n=1 Tax=Astyanax mexicanus TaxID=7994 RepID=A0A8B9KN34_ASTMX|nr:uncharacterized protein si:dkey-197j19.6 isoform X1 [Astyanax mexicanus]KAG9277180.1 hypothetical protein AMEX_G7173 [Astyanax mexicanus]
MSRIFSSLLSTRENGLLFNMLGQDCSVSACSVVQLFMATAACKGQKSEWKYHSCGVVCLVQDRKLHSSFIRVFCVKKAKLLWEQELYTPFQYSAPCPFFHTFPGDECQTGLNFTDEEEAGLFYSAVQNCIKNTKAHPVFMRTHSLDSTSGWLLRDKLNTCAAESGQGSRSSSPKTPTSPDFKASTPTKTPESKSFSVSTNQLSNYSKTLPNLKSASGSLAQRKGPLPPIPSNATSASTSNLDKLNLSSFSIPLPPSYPAPKINQTGVKKSASFAPGGSYSPSALKHHKSLHFTDDMQADTHFEDDE